jgi:exodeoxyribonuclease-5
VLVITRSNKNANLYNMQIRARIRWQENEISAGDYLMIVKNNYHWLPETSGAGFIANGDTVVIQRLGKFYEKGKFKFVDASIRFVDYPEQDDLDVKLLLNTLEGEQSNMPYHEMKELRGIIEDDYADILLKGERMQKMRKDPFLNALQVKFAYAVTCHKSQGGQWKCVFIDQGYLTEEMLDINYLRWLYTAVTRASEVLYFVNFIPQFFPENKN